jgi:hypothetical protein
VEPLILEGVIVEGDMLGLTVVLKYANHDITDENKFRELVPRKFFINSISFETHIIVIEPWAWARGWDKVGLLNLFDITRFGWIQ